MRNNRREYKIVGYSLIVWESMGENRKLWERVEECEKVKERDKHRGSQRK